MTLVHKKGLLLRCFTQNIDSLERQAGLPLDRIMAAHGTAQAQHLVPTKRAMQFICLRLLFIHHWMPSAATQHCRPWHRAHVQYM